MDWPAMYQRSSGVLCHITSLPGPHGIGDLGQSTYEFVEILAEAGQHLWQVLPLGPAGGGNSPYDSRSSFAGNPLMISIDALVDMDLLEQSRVPHETGFRRDRVEFGRVQRWKERRLLAAFERFQSKPDNELQRRFDEFHHDNKSWLDDFALYQSIRESHDGQPWYRWPDGLRHREKQAIAPARTDLRERVEFHMFVQWLFDEQWSQLKRHANDRSIAIMGDIPIYVALDSAEVWANQEQFLLDEDGQPEKQAGVPPDLFAKDGQLWGNPVYDWDQMEADDFSWWKQRVHRVMELTDIVRIDHFRGFAAGWQVPAEARTARNGEWVPGPGRRIFDLLQDELGELPIVVEDLGVITPDVEELRDDLGYPGMKVLQFAFGDGADNPYLPHNIGRNSMVYTGTHDNDTTRGWYDALPSSEKSHVRRYLNGTAETIHRDMIRAAWASVGTLACTPVQDVLGLGNEARMNIPGKARGNWAWRLEDYSGLRRRTQFLGEFTELYGRSEPAIAVADDHDTGSA
jgi:4-alpha-glucanotransferase